MAVILSVMMHTICMLLAYCTGRRVGLSEDPYAAAQSAFFYLIGIMIVHCMLACITVSLSIVQYQKCLDAKTVA